MLLATIKGMLGHKLRLFLTATSITLGVAFLAGTLMLTDSMERAFDEMFADAASGSDVVVRADGDGLEGPAEQRGAGADPGRSGEGGERPDFDAVLETDGPVGRALERRSGSTRAWRRAEGAAMPPPGSLLGWMDRHNIPLEHVHVGDRLRVKPDQSLVTAATRNTHGTGCTLSSAIAAYLALDRPMADAVAGAKDYLTNSLAAADHPARRAPCAGQRSRRAHGLPGPRRQGRRDRGGASPPSQPPGHGRGHHPAGGAAPWPPRAA